MQTNQPILTHCSDGIFQITINRAERKNALNEEMYRLMHAGLEQAGASDDVRVVLLKGSGGVFTSGNDLKDFANISRSESTLDEYAALKLMRALLTFKKPLVAAVNGVAVGFGVTLLLHCDLVIVDRTTKFQLPFVRLGLVPEFCSSALLPAIAGRARASRWLMLGESFPADEAFQMGLVSLLCDEGAAEAVALEECRKLAGLPPETLQIIKAMINTPEKQQHLLKVMDEEMALFNRCLKSPAHREALAAFFEKRAPKF